MCDYVCRCLQLEGGQGDQASRCESYVMYLEEHLYLVDQWGWVPRLIYFSNYLKNRTLTLGFLVTMCLLKTTLRSSTIALKLLCERIRVCGCVVCVCLRARV